ncbi:hypothetical protein DNTS_026365 [Danionella cerebrum]|uniref:Calmin n=1 Tax=Danionella cerebrum TaxID=2873325 RepID=A0A553N456_9TELE|nr:hypothetical protein DNTS_026365 [Danionella translucida]
MTESDGRVWNDQRSAERAKGVQRNAVQQRTFTKWINMHLKRWDPPLQVHHLFTDLQDGKILMALVEELSGCSLLHHFRPLPHRIFRLNNIVKVLNFLKDRNVSFFNIEAEDVADGNPPAVLSLIWNIIVFYQIKQVTESLEKTPSIIMLSFPCGRDSSGSLGSPGDDVFSTLSPKSKRSSHLLKYRSKAMKTLFGWAQNCTAKYGVDIQDFGKSWRSGLAFTALVKYFCPECVDMRKALSSEPRINIETALSAAHQWLGIPPLLDPDVVLDLDVAVPSSPDEQSVITYVAQFLECWPGHEEDSVSTDSSRCIPSPDRWDGRWSDSGSSQEELVDHPEEQALSFESLPGRVSTDQSLLASTGGQCCDSVGWRKRLTNLQEDDATCSKEAFCSIPELDSDEEDAYSYILELDHSETELESNIDLKILLDSLDAYEANTNESQGCFSGSKSVPDLLTNSSPDKGTDRKEPSPLKDAMLCNCETKGCLHSIEKRSLLHKSNHSDSNCSVTVKERVCSAEDDASGVSLLKNALHKVKFSEDFLVKDQHLCSHHFGSNSVSVQTAADRITGEPSSSNTKRKEGLDWIIFEVEDLPVLLLLWIITYCIFTFTHLDIYRLL